MNRASTGIAPWSGRAVQEARAYMAKRLPAPCGRCGVVIGRGEPFHVGHIKSRLAFPELTWQVSNWQHECPGCSSRSANEAFAEKALRDAGFSENGGRSKAPRLPFSLPEETRLEPLADLAWSPSAYKASSWLSGCLTVPEDAAPPLFMTPPHPDAVGSYGADAEEWARDALGVTLRWWQRLCLYRALEHRDDGSLCWRTVLMSSPRRAGKSILLQVVLMYRIRHGFEPFTEAVLTAGKMAQAKEIMRKCWRYADNTEGWKSRKANDSPEVETPDGDRLLLRPAESTAGYSPSTAVADEAWSIKPTFIDDDLAPSLLEREGGGQLWLVSTAHRRATSLMRTRVLDALTRSDGKTLLLLWGAPFDASADDLADPALWRSCSPYWTEDRADTYRDAYARALAGEEDPEADDPDPMQGFYCQLLNRWQLQERREAPGDPLTTPDLWNAAATTMPRHSPTSAAIEAGFQEGVCLALAYQDGTQTTVHVTDHPDLADAATALRATGLRTVTVGASLATDPALKDVRVQKGALRAVAAVQELSRLLADGSLLHTGQDPLSTQVLSVRTQRSTEGPRLLSRERTDAIKAAVWAIQNARKPAKGMPRIITI